MIPDTTPAFVISLDRTPERFEPWKSVDIGYPIQKFSAVDGKQMNLEEFKEKMTPFSFMKMVGGVKRSMEDINTKGAVACSLSHYGVWQTFLETYPDAPYLIVFEDDCLIKNYSNQKLKQIINNLYKKQPTGWDVWLLGALLRDTSDWNHPDPIPLASRRLREPLWLFDPTYPIMDVRSFIGTHAYIISRQGIEKLMETFFPIDTHIDSFMGLNAQMGRIRMISHKALSLKQPAEGVIDHGSFNISWMNQYDCFYKLIVLVALLIGLIYIGYLCVRKIKAGNVKMFVNGSKA